MIKKILLILFFIFIYPPVVFGSTGSVMVVNQIRGDEACCQPGTKDLVESIKQDELINKIPFGWAVRYDALKNDQLLDDLKKMGEIGILLEITPELAKESKVEYKGKSDGSDWYYAKNTFLIGYSIEERKKIIDTLFEKAKLKLGFYPLFTVSWMIDSWSINYLNNTYGVRIHELTKEQYETDSYTLYGGIFNSPYYPAFNHPLLPGYGNSKLNLLIVRQTISDLSYNYGSAKAFFTSQPNDYLTNKESPTNYFEKLIIEAIGQRSGPKFALLGFENSFSWEVYGTDFLKQLKYSTKLSEQGLLNIYSPSGYWLKYSKEYPENKAFYLTSDFSPEKDYGVLWYFGNNYRARIVNKEGKLIIDDLRNYSNIDDPYRNFPAVTDYAYWIIPYLFDGSQQYSLSDSQEVNLKKKGLLNSSTLSDYFTNPFGIVIGEGNFQLTANNDSVEILIQSKNSNIKLLPKEIIIDRLINPYFSNYNELLFEKNQILNFTKHLDFYTKKNNNLLEMGWLSEKGEVPVFTLEESTGSFHLRPVNHIDNLDSLNPIYQPDKSNYPYDSTKSIFYWNNKTAIVSRNPVRLFVLPMSKISRPAKVSSIEIKLSNNDGIKTIMPADYAYRLTPWFIDIISEKPGKSEVSIFIDGIKSLDKIPIEFIPNCAKKILPCLTSPIEGIKYIFTILSEQSKQIKTLWKKI